MPFFTRVLPGSGGSGDEAAPAFTDSAVQRLLNQQQQFDRRPDGRTGGRTANRMLRPRARLAALLAKRRFQVFRFCDYLIGSPFICDVAISLSAAQIAVHCAAGIGKEISFWLLGATSCHSPFFAHWRPSDTISLPMQAARCSAICAADRETATLHIEGEPRHPSPPPPSLLLALGHEYQSNGREREGSKGRLRRFMVAYISASPALLLHSATWTAISDKLWPNFCAGMAPHERNGWGGRGISAAFLPFPPHRR